MNAPQPREDIMRKHITILVVLAALLLAGCSRKADQRPLDKAGMGATTIHALQQMQLSDEEAQELARARQAGMSDTNCLKLARMARQRGSRFALGEYVAALRGVGVSENAVMQMAEWNQLNEWVVEAQALHLAGFSDETLLALAENRSKNRAVISGPSLVKLKNANFTDYFLHQLAVRAVADEQTNVILDLRRRRRWSEADILKNFPAPADAPAQQAAAQ